MSHDLLILNARVLTADPHHPTAAAIAVRGGRIAAAGSVAECRRAAPAGAAVLDLGGRTVIPGIVDAHIHLTAFAAALRSVDCSGVRSIDALLDLLQAQAAALPPGAWLRASGYDESTLAEGRHPTRWEIDAAVPDRPVRLLHRSGHAAVLNSEALARAGISIATEEPAGGAIDRRIEDGEPTGLLLEMNDHIGRVLPPLPRGELVAGLHEAGARLLAAGVTAVQDLSHTNTAETDRFLSELAVEARFLPRLLPPAEGWQGATAPLSDDPRRPVKLMLREAGARPEPDTAGIAAVLAACAGRGRAAAVHAVSRPAVEAVVRAFERTGAAGTATSTPWRIEHAGVCPPPLIARIAALGVQVVLNPGFIWHSAARYRRSVPAAEQPYLHDVGGFEQSGVTPAAGSDAPVAPATPLPAMKAAMHRRGRDGTALPGTGCRLKTALAMHTRNAALAAGTRDLGVISAGMRADLVVLDGEPGISASVVRTLMDGAIVWEARRP